MLAPIRYDNGSRTYRLCLVDGAVIKLYNLFRKEFYGDMSGFLIAAYEWLVCLGEAVFVYVLFKNKHNCEKPKIYIAIALLPLFATLTYVMNNLGVPWVLLSIISVIVHIAYSFVLFQATPTMKCLWGVVPVVVFCISNFVTMIIFFIVINLGGESLFPGNIARIVGQFIYMALNFTILLPLLKIRKENGELPMVIRSLSILLALIGIAFSMYSFSKLASAKSSSAETFEWVQCAVVLSFSIVLLVFSGYLSRLYQKHLETQKDLQKRKLEAEHVSQVSAMYDYVRSWRHDVKGMVSTLSGLCQRGDYESMNKYLNELGAAAEETKVIVSTGNPAIDATISAKLMLANKKGVSVTHTISIPENISLKATDVCSIIMNLLDNAIEASSEMPENERWMEFSLIKKKDMLTFTVTNSCNGNYEYIGEKLQTTKDNPSVHGIGLNRVASITKKYDGYLLIDPQSNIFRATVLLPMEEK